MKPILTMDFETDPFTMGHATNHPRFQGKYGVPGSCACGCRMVKPFAAGLYDGRDFISVWSKKCAAKMVEVLSKREPGIIYMHNGGRFDIFYLMQWLEAEMTIINGRIVKAWLGKHELRDSYAILPVSLGSTGKKKSIDISKLHESCRELHRVEILEYLQQDCVGLHELVTGFRDEFGDYLTIGSAAMAQLKRFHPFERGNAYMDEKFRRPQHDRNGFMIHDGFYKGGRVQCFQSGIIETPYKIHDINSAYPYVMKNLKHPAGVSCEVSRTINPNTAFIVAEGINHGAFPRRNRKGGIDFTEVNGTFCCTIHEWNMAEETGMFKPTKVLKTYGFDEWIWFDGFVDHFYGQRLKAKRNGDEIRVLFYKLILNSAYGKFAQNPDNFFDYSITHGETMPATNGVAWKEHFIHNEGQYVIWKKPVSRHSYYNVAIGASITGATRAMLMQGISKATNVIYCDTDSIISEDLKGVPFSTTALGAWKFEGAGNRLAIAGKKMYACFDDTPGRVDPKTGELEACIKSATKGAKLSSEEIVRAAMGEKIRFEKLAPTFKLDGRVVFIGRDIRRTV